jgi:hypothetical protein
MNYCTLDEAFESIPDQPPAHRKKSRRAKEGFQNRLLPPEPAVIEPDRPANRPLPPAELLGGGPTTNIQSTSQSAYLNGLDTQPYFPHPNEDVQRADVYQLEPNWAKVFQDQPMPSWIKDRMAPRTAEVPLVPSAWVDGSPTLWQQIPAELQGDPTLVEASHKADDRLDTIQQKLDTMFQKLDDLDRTRSESNHIEILMFILGGIFLLFMLDLLVKQGTQATMMLAAAGGGLMKNTRFSRLF